jgi:hypothetical protein
MPQLQSNFAFLLGTLLSSRYYPQSEVRTSLTRLCRTISILNFLTAPFFKVAASGRELRSVPPGAEILNMPQNQPLPIKCRTFVGKGLVADGLHLHSFLAIATYYEGTPFDSGQGHDWYEDYNFYSSYDHVRSSQEFYS